MLKRPSTQLSVIPTHQLWLECACGHNGPVDVAAIIAKFGDQITVDDAIERLRCSLCRSMRIKEFRIIYVGGSWGAMRGAEQVLQKLE
jgi:hypothetical protein